MVIAFSIIALIGAGLFFSGRKKDCELIDVITDSLTGFFFSYVLFTALLLLPDFFTVKKAAFLTMVFWAALCIIGFIRGYRPSFSFSLKPYIVPITAALIGVILISAVPFDYFGMGQDQGVFQTEAIMYARGRTDKQTDIREYHVADTDSEKEQILSALTEPNLLGTKYYDETNIFRLLTGSSRFSLNGIAQVFHGLHTFSSLLALGAVCFGIRNMIWINTILFVLCIFRFSGIMTLLKIPDKIKIIILSIFILSPQVIWCAKSALTEIGITLIWFVLISLFIKGTSKDLMFIPAVILIFGLYHVSLYVMMPLIVLIFAGIWLIKGEKAALKGMILSVLMFLVSFVIDVFNNTDYTLKSYAPLFKGPVNIGNIFYFVTGTCIVTVIAGLLLLHIKKPQMKISPKATGAAVRVILLLILAYSAFRLITGKTDTEEIFRLTFLCLTLLSGIAVPLTVYIDMLIHPAKWTDRQDHAVILSLYLYCVIFFSIVMLPQVQYCYYYSRYLCMYIPMILLAGGIVLTRYKKTLISLSCLAVSIAVLLPYSALLIRDKDDSRTQWDNLMQVEQTLQNADAEAVFLSPSLFHYFYYDLKSLDIDVYPIFDDFENESADIAAKYVRVYILDDGSSSVDLEGNYPLIMRTGNMSSMDWELMLSRPFLLPNAFTKEYTSYSVYEFVH